MNINLKVNLAQKLTLSQSLHPSLLQKFKILQYSYHDLQRSIEESCQDNIMLDITDNYIPIKSSQLSYSNHDEDVRSLAISDLEPVSLEDYLLKQVKLIGLPLSDFRVISFLIHSLDERGYFTDFSAIEKKALDRFSLSKRKLLSLLKILQNLEPDGVGARSLSECLALQVEHYNFEDPSLKKPILAVVKHHLQAISEKKFKSVAISLSLPENGIIAIADFIKQNLDPSPCSKFIQSHTSYIRPSFKVELSNNQLKLLNLETSSGPTLSLSSRYQHLLNEAKGDASATVFLTQQLKKAKELISAINHREDHLNKLVKTLLSKQEAAFRHGLAYLTPLSQKSLSQELSLSPSMISRTLSQKYVETPFGLLSLRQFCPRNYFGFTKERFLQVIKHVLEEFPRASDQQISRTLIERGISIARRTIAKYRHELAIPARFMAVPRSSSSL
ncbi:MAG: hypothetical protein VW378_02120 [bacterium]